MNCLEGRMVQMKTVQRVRGELGGRCELDGEVDGRCSMKSTRRNRRGELIHDVVHLGEERGQLIGDC